MKNQQNQLVIYRPNYLQNSKNTLINPSNLTFNVLSHINSRFNFVHKHIEQSKQEIIEKLEKKHKKNLKD